MILGEKIRELRKKCGFSQEQLAEKLSVSRSAVAKWETDKGLPDVGNLKLLARLLNVSVDHLLDESEAADPAVIREPYQLAAYGRGCSRVKKDRVVREKFPDARIYTLFGRQDLPDTPPSAEPAPDCGAGALDPGRNRDKAFYLVERDDRCFFVTVTDLFVEIRPVERSMEDSRFELDGWHFIRSNYELPE